MERTPEDWSGGVCGWLNLWAAAVGIEDDGRSDHQISEFYRKGVNSPAHCGQKLNFTLISLKVEVFSAAKCPLHRAGPLRNQGFP